MPMPAAYRHAGRDFAAFLEDAKEALGLGSDNMAYTAVDGVFQVFRRRLSVADGLRFADLLPAVPRAIFVAGWVPAPPVPFGARAALVREVQAVRAHHNLTPPHAIEAVAWAVRRHVRQIDFDRLLAQLPDGAEAYWQVAPGAPPPVRRIV